MTKNIHTNESGRTPSAWKNVAAISNRPSIITIHNLNTTLRLKNPNKNKKKEAI